MSNETISFPRELSDDLAEFIAEKARVCGGGAYDIWEALCERFGQPAEQPAPISSTSDKYKAELYDEVWQLARDMGFGSVTDALMQMKKQPAPVAVVPEVFLVSKEEFDEVVKAAAAEIDSKSPVRANPPPGTDPCGTHHDNDGLDEWRKPGDKP